MSQKKLVRCVNGDGRPIYSPSKVLCKECFEALDRKMQSLAERSR